MKLTGSIANVTSVGDTTTSTTLLAANDSRVGGVIFNNSTAVLYVLMGTGTASSSNFSISLEGGQYFTIPAVFKGALIGVWASDAGGTGLVTEFV